MHASFHFLTAENRGKREGKGKRKGHIRKGQRGKDRGGVLAFLETGLQAAISLSPRNIGADYERASCCSTCGQVPLCRQQRGPPYASRNHNGAKGSVGEAVSPPPSSAD